MGVDDANIYFVYMKHVANGYGLVYTISGENIEGFTSLLYYFPHVPSAISGGGGEGLGQQLYELKNLALQVVERRLEDLDQILALAGAMPLQGLKETQDPLDAGRPIWLAL